MTKIEVEGIKNVLTRNFTQISHFIDLYSIYIYGTIKDDLNNLSDEPMERELGESYTSWATEEVLKLGLVTIFHYWEKQLNALLKEQAEKLGLTIPERKRQSFNGWAKKVLENQFSCNVDGSIWDIIDEMREIVNSYKHGNSNSFEKLYEKYPHYFSQQDFVKRKPFDEKFFLGIDNFKKLTEAALKFWEKIPHTVKW